MFFDVLYVGDFRFLGGTSTAVAAEVKALSDAGYRIGLVFLATGLHPVTRDTHPDILTLVAHGNVTLVPRGWPVRTKLCLLAHPMAFTAYPADPLQIVADQTILVVHHPPIDGFSAPNYDVAAIDSVTRNLFGPVQWAPVGPVVRETFEQRSFPCALTNMDWTGVIELGPAPRPRDWSETRNPVIGRHSRPDRLKFPATPDEFLAAYPDDPRVSVEFMGFPQECADMLPVRPGNWRIHEFGAMPPAQFLSRLDAFVYFHHTRWREAFGRAALEAMAAGVPTVLPRYMRSTFGEAAIYADSSEILDIALSIRDQPEVWRRQADTARGVVEESFSPAVVVRRVAGIVGKPVSQARKAPSPSRARTKRAMFVTSNGIGMGHLVRSLAVARQLDADIDPVIITMSKAFQIAESDGIHCEYLPFLRYPRLEATVWNASLQADITDMVGFYRPDILIFDGNRPYPGLCAAMEKFPGIWKLWQRRAMWPAEAGLDFLDAESAFDAVLEPGELAAALDRGPTTRSRAKTRSFPPVVYLREGEALSRTEARTALGIPQDAVAAILQLGSGNNTDRNSVIRAIDEILPRNVRLFAASWQNEAEAMQLSARYEALSLFPYAKFLAAFDFSIAAAGYNTFHENLSAGLPTIFVPNEHPEQDEQVRRALFAASCGMAFVARAGQPWALANACQKLLDPVVRERISTACMRLKPADGAREIAQFISHLAGMRKMLA